MSLASLQRRITRGTLLKLVRHDWFPNNEMVINGNLGKTTLKGRVPTGTVRPVVAVHTTEIGFATPGCTNGISWLQWPAARCVRETTNGFEVCLNQDGTFREVMGYEFA